MATWEKEWKGNRGEELLKAVETEEYRILTDWKEGVCSLALKNLSGHPVRLEKIPVLEMDMPFGPDTPVYGEAYNMLCQYSGTVKKVDLIGFFGDHGHYRLSAPKDFCQVYNLIRFTMENGESLLLGFSSCRRFSGEFWFNEKKLYAVLNLEGIEIREGETVALETLFEGKGPKETLEEAFGNAIQTNHPMLRTPEIPTGWCSWPVYGPQVTEQNIYDNLNAIKEQGLNLKYIQLDDGYQPFMGDWLQTTDAFQGGMEKMCLAIKEQGFEPAIWVAPFIAEEKSELFQKHPGWFVKDTDGKPLASDRVSFGGWRCGPWYMLDGTHPEARNYLSEVFRTMREKWQVKYYKMDAIMWGALPFGVRFEKNRTSVEAYRMGMRAILEGAGEDSFLLGCNAPMWPSLGLVHGMRVTNDISRNFDSIKEVAREGFFRNWQNNRLWINDPDTVLLRNSDKVVPDPEGKPVKINTGLSRSEFLYNASYVLASGGMVLAGDNLAEFTEQNRADLNKLLPPLGQAAVFETDDHAVGRIALEKKEILCVFNPEDSGRDFPVQVKKTAKAVDFWTGEELGVWTRGTRTVRVEGRSAAVVVLEFAGE